MKRNADAEPRARLTRRRRRPARAFPVPRGGRVAGVSRRALSVALAVVLLAVQTPAAPQVLSGLAAQWRGGLAFWLESSARALRGLALPQRGPAQKKQERQAERDARVARVQVSPAEATIRAGERVRFAAVAYDQDGAPVGGVRFEWHALDTKGNRRVRISRRGEFESRVGGAYKVVARAGGYEAQAVVRVLAVKKGRKGEQPSGVKRITTRDEPPDAPPPQAKSKSSPPGRGPSARARRAALIKSSYAPTAAAAPAAALPANDEWNQANYMYADDPGNERGDPPGGSDDDGAGSGNFHMIVPVLDLPGRGIDLSLDLAYNSRVWSKTSSYEMAFDPDRDWPAPGWSLGFGKMVGMNTGGSMMIDGDGTRHSFGGDVTSYGWGATYFNGYTADGTLVDYWTYSYQGTIYYGWARLPNGTTIDYGAPGQGSIYPTRIMDANGNYILITYRNNQGPHLDTVTDTLGRIINFHYDANNLLTAISAPRLDGGARTLVRLHYKPHTLQYGFAPGLTARVRDYYPSVIDAIYYPGTQTGYWLGDWESYSSYGMLSKVSERRAMGFSAASLNEQGAVTSAGSLIKQVVYNYPLVPDNSLTNAPTYTTRTLTWDAMSTPAAVTTYTINQNATPSRVEVEHPNGAKSIQLSYNAPGQWYHGLTYQDETRDANNNLLQTSTVSWQLGAYESARPARIEATDERGQVTGTEFFYNNVYNQVREVCSYDYGYVYGNPNNVLLRRTLTEYETAAGYTARHIFNLARSVEVYDPAGTRVARVEYQYDGATPPATPNGAASLSALPTDVVNHDDTHDPFDPQYWVEGYWEQQCDEFDHCYPVWVPGYWTSDYSPATDYRGNVTGVTNFADAGSWPAAGAITETRRYDITGNMVSSSTSCCEQNSFSYTQDTQYAYAQAQTRGSATDAAAQITTRLVYDFNTGLVRQTVDPNGRTTWTNFDAETLRPQQIGLPTNGHTDYAYDDAALSITETTYLAPAPVDTGAVANKRVSYMNGLGQVRRQESLGANNVWDVTETEYDVLARVWKQSRPYRSGEAPQWNETVYDALGRVTALRGADGSEAKAFYNETARPSAATPGNPAGQTTRLVDAWGRERWGRTNAQGQLVEVVEPDPSGDGTVWNNGLLTSYVYDGLGNLAQVNQGVQQRRFRYDSLGRLTHQKLAETLATLNDAGQYAGPGAQWGDFFTYDVRSNLVSRTDARGVTTNFNYNDDPLNRIQSISYTVGAQHDTSSPIAAAATVTYEYMPDNDRTRLKKIQTAGVGTEEYGYDSEGRPNYKKQTLTSRPNHPMETNFAYDSLSRVTEVTYPAQYQAGVYVPARKVVHHDYDVASRLSALKVDGASYASQFVYNAASQPTSLKVGAGGANQVTESYSFDPATGLLSEQRVFRGTDPNANKLLHLSYDYLRPGTTSGRTGQLTKVTNHLNAQRGRGYSYDTLGRLVQARGGDQSNPAPLWTQTYSYDRYGNRTGVAATGQTASLATPEQAKPTPLRDQIAFNHAQPLPEALRGDDAGRAVSDGPLHPSLLGAAFIGPPTNVSPTSASGTQINLSWTAPGGGVDHYEVERSQSVSGPYSLVSGTTATSFADTTVSAGTAYLYRVRAVSVSGSYSPYSNVALGTAIAFTDPSLVAGATVISALHVTELRQAVNAVRRSAGLADAAWTDSSLAGVTIKAVHVQELRDNLNTALTALNVPTSAFTDAVLATGAGGTIVKKIHIEELRQRATRGASNSSGGGVPGGTIPRDGLASVSYDGSTNRVSTPGWEYDALGNQTRAMSAAGTWQRMEYDAANRLVRVTDDARSVVFASYTYGDSNSRLVTQEGSTRTYYAWGSGAVIAEYTEVDGTSTATQPQWLKNYIYLGDRLLATQQPGGGGERVEYHHPDRLGTRLVTNNLDATYFEQTTLPYGTALTAESTGETRRLFTSYERSATTGLDYAVNRHYDPQQGRFTQVDPIGMGSVSLGNPQTLNLYAYCLNDPVNHTDPDGLLFGFLKKLFKGIGKIFKAVAKLFIKVLKVAAQIALKVIASKVGRLIIGIAIIVFFSPMAPLFFAVEGGAISMSTTSLLLAGLQAAGSIASHLREERRKSGVDKKAIAAGAVNLALQGRGGDKIPSDEEGAYECSSFFDTCKEMGEKIRDLTNGIRKRFEELDPNTESYPGHTEIWARQKNILNRCLQRFAEKGCNDNDDLPPGFPMKDAVAEAGRKAKPVTSLGDFRRRGGLVPVGILLCTVAPAACGVLILKPKPVRVPVPVPVPAH